MPHARPLSLPEAADQLLAALAEGQDAAVFVVLSDPDPGRAGERVVVRGGALLGSFGDSVADHAALRLAQEGLSGDVAVLPGRRTLPTEGGEELQVYVEFHHPAPEMVIVGAGHLAQPLCTLGDLLGLQVRVLDDRPEFATLERFPEAREVRRVDFADPFGEVPLHPWSHVILVTRGHRHDYECLRKVLHHTPAPGYVGMIGSRRRVRATFEALLREGIPRELLATVHAPIGLDIGAETPSEIAVSVAAELVHHWRGGTGAPLQEAERVLDRMGGRTGRENRSAPGERQGRTTEEEQG